MRESDLFEARASACQADADAATLDNVKERSLRAGRAWAEMADRSRRTEAARAVREAAVVSRMPDAG
jgi:hypothetical protein